jgi:probable lipoprotein (TIGR04455 family)
MSRLLLVAVLLFAACGPVRHSWVHPEYEDVDRTATLRLAVVTSPLPGDDGRVGELWSALARQYANQHRDFIASRSVASGAFDLAEICDDGLEGVLHLLPTELVEAGKGYRLGVEAKLLRCRDGEAVWEARARGRWASEDPHLVEVRRRYVASLGEEVGPVVAPSFRLLRAILGTLPRPELTTDEDVMEKIELGE